MEQAVQLTPPLLRNGYSYNEETEKIELRIADDFLFYHQYGVSMTTLNEMMRPIHLAHQPKDPSINQAIAQLFQEAREKLPQLRAELWQTLREDLKPLGFEIQEYQDPDSVFLKPHIEYRRQ